MTDVVRLAAETDKHMRAGFAAGDIFRDSDNSRAFDEAYDRWMRARAAAGDPFAVSLGYRKV
jgi:hypothetical protein